MKPAKQYERSTKGLRDMLFDAIEQVQAGTMKATQAVQLASVVRQIVATADLELRVQKQQRELGTADPDAIVIAPPIVALGHSTGDD